MSQLPKKFLEDTLKARKHLVELLLEKGMSPGIECELIRASYLLSPIVATYGPAGINAAPFMVSYLVKEQCFEEALNELKTIEENYWGKGMLALSKGLRFILDYVYNEKCSDPTKMVSHVMSKGHTWTNIVSNKQATLAILIPPDKGAYEVRTTVDIYESGPIFEYVNLLHDLMHAIPEGERSHPWYPAIVFTVQEIYDNSYQKLGEKIYP
ncbi:MAG: hypothetical protein GSR79_08980 [Desulfurococcales archaeon]|nr:hypothetical protein [Desulfurococcales archaeon]